MLGLRSSTETIEFADLSYFWGQMGAGKTSIARLSDYCLGGDIQLSPALQSEFVEATLNLGLEKTELSLERPRDSDLVIAGWTLNGENYQTTIPAREPAGEVIPGTGVENLSDLIFWLSGLTPPRVRRSKVKPESETGRLSIRDLLWYCYLDQDEIDSSFFNLEERGHPYKRPKSRDVMRFIIGFHNEYIAELEAQLDTLRGQKQALMATISGLSEALKEMEVESEQQIMRRVQELTDRADRISIELQALRERETTKHAKHAADELIVTARSLGEEVAKLDGAIQDLVAIRERDQRHLNELDTLEIKFRRSRSAREILSGVQFELCPRCTQPLPVRGSGTCPLCGQAEASANVDDPESERIERDIAARRNELKEIMSAHDSKLDVLRRDRRMMTERKDTIERERNEILQRYDSAYLSTALAKERERASLLQEAASLNGLVRLPQMLSRQYQSLSELEGKERSLRAELKTARAAAESDDSNLERLKRLFLDCLLRSGVPGITPRDTVRIPTTSFLPEVVGPNGHAGVTSFGNISSGGKKTLFKCCFAIAVHRLAVGLNSPLPRLLMIDSPMKNISERENRANFESFYRMVYDLKATELSETQVILIDKEFFPPPRTNVPFKVISRHMTPTDSANPPLIPYYRGK